MQITVLAVGSRGEVEPLVALAAGLCRAGHQVCLATHEEFAALAADRGLAFARLWGSVDEALATDAGQRLIHSGRNVVRGIRALAELIPPVAARLYDDCWHACRPAEAVVYGQIAVAGPHIAEKRGVPAIGASVNPLCPGRATAAFPAPGLPPLPIGGWYNRLTHEFVTAGFAALWQPTLNRWRQRRLGLPAVSHRRIFSRRNPLVYGFSPTLVPRPKEWRKNTTITGYWFLDPPTGWHPPQRVIDFLGAGAAPLYLGFGSMRDKERSLTGIVVDALRLTRQRGVLLLPGAEPDEVKLPDHILAVEPMPFSWLLPRVAAVVHHGGLGTCHAALRAGTPQVVVPFMGDQSFWAQRVARLGVGPAPIPRHRLSAANLAAAIEIAVKNPQTRAIAAEAASQIGKEQGLTGAVAFIQRHLSVAGEPL